MLAPQSPLGIEIEELTINRKPTSLNSNTHFFPQAISKLSRSKVSESKISSRESAYLSRRFGMEDAWKYD